MEIPLGKSWVVDDQNVLPCGSKGSHFDCLLNNEDLIKRQYGLELQYDPNDDIDLVYMNLWQSVKNAGWIRAARGATVGLTLPSYRFSEVSNPVFNNVENILFNLPMNTNVEIDIPMTGKHYIFIVQDFIESGMKLGEFLLGLHTSKHGIVNKLNWYKFSQKNVQRLQEEIGRVRKCKVPENLQNFSYSWGVIDKENVVKLYALEYKISQILKKGKYLGDDDYILYNRYYTQARELSNKLIPKLLAGTEAWLHFHAISTTENIGYGGFTAEQILMAWGYLRNALSLSVSLEEKIKAINIALHVMHGSGQSLVAIADFEYIPDPTQFSTYGKGYEDLYNTTNELTHEEWQLLEDLSQGKYIPEWEREMQLRADRKINWYKFAQQIQNIKGLEQDIYNRRQEVERSTDFSKRNLDSRSWGVIKKEDIIRFYALEYKLATIGEQGDYLEDSAFIYYQRLYHEALSLCKDIIPKFLNIVEAWILHHSEAKPYEETGEYLSSQHNQLRMAWGYLRNALSSSASLSDKFKAINITLHIIHYNGQSLIALDDFEFISDIIDENSSEEVFQRYDDINEMSPQISHQEWQLLQDLSGGKYIPEWEREMQLRANRKINWYKFAAMSVPEALETLNLPQDFSLEVLKRTRSDMMRKWHPDINRNPQALEVATRINQAFQVLRDHLSQAGNFTQESTPGSTGGVSYFYTYENPQVDPEAEAKARHFEGNIQTYLHAILKNRGMPITHQPKYYYETPAKSWVAYPIFDRFIERAFNAFIRTMANTKENYRNNFVSNARQLYTEGQSLYNIIVTLYEFLQKLLRN